MSGPIVRSGPTPLFSNNWDSIFGGKKKTAAKAKPAKAKAAKKPSAKKKAAPAKKKAGKKK